MKGRGLPLRSFRERAPLQVGVALFALAIVVLAAAWQSREPITVDLGAKSGNIDTLYVTGFHSPKVRGNDTYRWSRPQSSVHFLGIGDARWQLKMRLASARDESSPPVSVALLGGDGSKAFDRIDTPPQDFGDYIATTSPPVTFKGDLHLVIGSSAVLTSTDDPREKGIALDRVTLVPQGLVIPPLGNLLSLALGTALLGIAVGIVFGTIAGLVSGVAFLGAFTWLIGWHRLWLTPFVGQIVLMTLILLAGVTLTRVIVSAYAPYAPRVSASMLPSNLDGPGSGSGTRAHDPAFGPGAAMRLALAGLLVCIFAYALVQFGYELVLLFDKPRAVDFQAYWQATKGMSGGAPLYDLDNLRDNPFGSFYKYPPILAGLLQALTFLDFDTGRDLWRGLCVGFVFAAVAVVVYGFAHVPVRASASINVMNAHGEPRYESGQPGGNTSRATESYPSWMGLGSAWAVPAALGLLFVTLLFHPTIDALNYGQLDPLILLLLAVTLVGLRSDRPVVAGVSLALATSLKLYPGALVLFLIVRREWRALAAFTAGLLVWAMVGMLLTSPQDTWTYITHVLPASGGTTAWIENQTLNGFVARLLTDRIGLEQFASDLPARALKLSLLNYAVAALVIGATLWLSYSGRRTPAETRARSGSAYALGFASIICATIFVLPAAWLHYYVAFLLPLGVALYCLQADGISWWLRSPRLVTASVVCLGLGTVLLMFGNMWLFYNRDNLGGIWKLLLSYKFYGAVVFWAGLVLMQQLARSPRQENLEVSQTVSARGAEADRVSAPLSRT